MTARTFGKLGILALLVMLIAGSVAPISAATRLSLCGRKSESSLSAVSGVSPVMQEEKLQTEPAGDQPP